jgi:hypothetical protein
VRSQKLNVTVFREQAQRANNNSFLALRAALKGRSFYERQGLKKAE